MLDKLPPLYFRRRRNGAAVFRVLETPYKRLELELIAVLKPGGEILPRGNGPTAEERTQISAQPLAGPDILDDLGQAAQWLQAEADDQTLRAHAQDILLAIHDLRSTLVKRLGRIEE